MKSRSILIACLLLPIVPAFAQPCLPQGITFTTQSQIDSFPISNPNCSEIQGFVYITGNDINNLHGLSCITSIGTDLYIRNTSSLTNLSGLNNLTNVGRELSIGENSSLNSLAGLGGLEIIGSAFELDNNPLLLNLNGLNSLTSIGGYMKMSGNKSLINLTGLDSLDSVGGVLNIDGNPFLDGLSGLINLHSIGEGLIINQNYSLKSLAGLDNIDANSIKYLYIADNDSLSKCDILSICNFLSSPQGNVVILNNTTGCNSVAEVEASCQTISTQETDLSESFMIYPNPAQKVICFPSNYKGSIKEVNVYDEKGVRRLVINPESDCIDISMLPDGYYIVGFEFKDSSARKHNYTIIKDGNY